MLTTRLLRRAFPLLLALGTPAGLHAQFGGMGGGMGGMGRGGMGGMGRGGRGGGMPTGAARRTEPLVNTVDLILKRAHDLTLTDSQVVRLTAVKARQDSGIAAVRARLDSLSPRAARGESGSPADDPIAMSDRMQRRGELMAAYRDVLRKGRDEAFATLEKKQRKTAEKLEKELKKEMQDPAPDEPGGWGSGRRGRGVGGAVRD